MSEAHTEPHVSGQELREALAQHGRTRPNPLMATSEAPAWEWTTDEQAELEQLRESTAELQTEVDRLRGVAADGRAREKELRDALQAARDDPAVAASHRRRGPRRTRPDLT